MTIPAHPTLPHPSGPAIMRQDWQHLLFLHWKIDPALLQPLLPPGLTIETRDGSAWLGVVPFYMNRIRPRFLPPVPGLSWFLELNVRTYVVDDEGRQGVWFFSLDCDNRIAVHLARTFFHLPYFPASMSAKWKNNTLTYRCQRVGREVDKEAEFCYQPPDDVEIAPQGSLEHFLVERYRLFSWSPRQRWLLTGEVRHEPYAIGQPIIKTISTLPLSWNGFPYLSEQPDHAIYSPGVKVWIWPTERCGKISSHHS